MQQLKNDKNSNYEIFKTVHVPRISLKNFDLIKNQNPNIISVPNFSKLNFRPWPYRLVHMF